MKKLILLCFLLSSLSSLAIPIFSMIKYDGGRRGYNYVSGTLSTNSQGQEGWVIECHDPGREECGRPHGNNSGLTGNFDDIDLSKGEELIELADNRYDDGEKSGSISVLVQVENEPFLRQYVVVWSTQDRFRYIDVTREDITL